MNTSSLLMIVVLAIAISVTSCDSSETVEEYHVTVQTDKLRYDGAPQISGSYTVENTGEKVVYFFCGGCGGIEEWIGDDLVGLVWSQGCNECGGIDRLVPGGQHTWRFRLDDGDSGLPAPEFSSRTRYRVSPYLYKDENQRQPLAKDEVTSRWFEMLP